MPLVLLVEDNLVNQKVALGLLGRLELAVDVAGDGLQGLQSFRAKAYDLIIMDCEMPRLDGWECTRAIRRLEASSGRHVPIIALTAQALPEDRRRCLEAGMDDYLTKPVDPDLLERAVRSHLGSATPPRPAPVVAAPAVVPEAPLIDPAVVAKLSAYGPEALAEVYGILRDELPGRHRQLANALALGDLKTLGTLAHAVKGGSGTLGCRDLQRRAAEVEARARAGDLAACQALWPGFDTCLTATATALASIAPPLSTDTP